MPKDFARRRGASTAKRSKAAKRINPKQRVVFHGPSFCTGALVGAAIVILTAYGPQLLELDENVVAAATEQRPAQPRVNFEFPDILKNMEVKADPEPYAVPAQATGDIATTYSIQAASFRLRDDAERLRAKLLLEGLPAKTTASEVDGKRWYRVAVGPFARRVEANRAMTRLREQKLSAIWINNHN